MLNIILTVLVLAVCPRSAAASSHIMNCVDIGIQVPSANHSIGRLGAHAPSFNLQPSIILEPTGIYGLRADGLSGWQRAGVWSTELIAGGVGHGLTFLPAFLGFVSAAYEGSQFTTRDMWLCLALWPGCGTLICPTAVWLTGRYGFQHNVSWWEPALGSGAGLAASSALIGLSLALDKYHGGSAFRNAAIDYLGYAGELGLAALIPIGAVIGANHR